MAISQQQQQLNLDKFKAAQERARKLISNDAKQEAAEGRKPKYVPSLMESGAFGSASSNSYDNDYEENEPQYLSEEQMSKLHQQAQQMPIREGNVRNNKVPEAILKSMKSNPINTSVLESNLGMESTTSVLDTLGIKPQMKQQKKMQIVENTQTPSSTAIDYSLIKTIVEDCIRKSLNGLKKTMLQENINNAENNLGLIQIGETFKFVTKNGDIFEATLKKKSNIYDNKKG